MTQRRIGDFLGSYLTGDATIQGVSSDLHVLFVLTLRERLNVDVVIEEVSMILRNMPGLLRDFNVLLANYDRRIECATHAEGVHLITVVASSETRIQTIPRTENVSTFPSNHVVSTAQLRRMFSSSEAVRKELVELKSEWASCVEELIQTVCSCTCLIFFTNL